MKTLRKRKIAKANEMKYYKGHKIDGYRTTYYLDDVKENAKLYGTFVNYPYTENFIKELQWLKDNR